MFGAKRQNWEFGANKDFKDMKRNWNKERVRGFTSRGNCCCCCACESICPYAVPVQTGLYF